MTYKFKESVVEEACLQYFGQLKYEYLPARKRAVHAPSPEPRAAGRKRCRVGR